MAKMKSTIGSWTFLIGVVIAILFGLFSAVTPTILVILVIIGLIVGLLNISDVEAESFLWSGAALVIVASLGQNVMQAITVLDQVIQALLGIFVPATIVVAIRNVFGMARM